MTAHDLARYLQAYCDGELEPTKILEVEGHLEECATCRRSVEAERAFREELRRRIPREAVPAHVTERLGAALDDIDRTEGSPARPVGVDRRIRPGALAAAVLLVTLGAVLGYLIPRLSSPPGVAPLVTELVSEHMKSVPLENPAELPSKNTEQVAFWVQGRIGHAVRVPDYSEAGIQLLGGRVTRVGGHRAGYIVYKKGGTMISLFAFPGYEASIAGLTEIRQEGRAFQAGEYRGKQVLLWESGHMTYALVSDMGWAELFRCAQVFFQAVHS